MLRSSFLLELASAGEKSRISSFPELKDLTTVLPAMNRVSKTSTSKLNMMVINLLRAICGVSLVGWLAKQNICLSNTK